MRTSPPRPGERLRRLTADAILQAIADAPDQVLALTAAALDRWVTTQGELSHAFVIADGGVWWTRDRADTDVRRAELFGRGVTYHAIPFADILDDLAADLADDVEAWLGMSPLARSAFNSTHGPEHEPSAVERAQERGRR